jgi:hypothetical protein
VDPGVPRARQVKSSVGTKRKPHGRAATPTSGFRDPRESAAPRSSTEGAQGRARERRDDEVRTARIAVSGFDARTPSDGTSPRVGLAPFPVPTGFAEPLEETLELVAALDAAHGVRPWDAKERVERLLTGWFGYFGRSRARSVANSVLGYSHRRRACLLRTWHQWRRSSGYGVLPKVGLSLVGTRGHSRQWVRGV